MDFKQNQYESQSTGVRKRKDISPDDLINTMIEDKGMGKPGFKRVSILI